MAAVAVVKPVAATQGNAWTTHPTKAMAAAVVEEESRLEGTVVGSYTITNISGAMGRNGSETPRKTLVT